MYIFKLDVIDLFMEQTCKHNIIINMPINKYGTFILSSLSVNMLNQSPIFTLLLALILASGPVPNRNICILTC